MASRFLQALTEKEAVDVKMNGVIPISFIGPSFKAIRTQNLNSYIVIIMASTTGAILTYLIPRLFFISVTRIFNHQN